MPNWKAEQHTFVARTQQSREVLASVAIAAKGFPVYLPMRSVERSHAGKRERVSRPLFPRYIFVNFVEMEKQYGQINRCRGVVRLISDIDGLPVRVPPRVIQDMRERERVIGAQAGIIKSGWQPGDTFKLVCGKYADFEVAYVGEDKGEVTVLARLFGRDFLVPVPFAAIPICHQMLDSSAA